MPDQLQQRFDALRNVADHLDAGGLGDVHARRTRRTRTLVATASAATVAALALAGVLVLPQLTQSDTTSASGGQALGEAAAGPGSDQGSAQDEPLSDPGAATVVPPVEADLGPIKATQGGLLTWPDIQAVGETGPGTSPYAASLVFPPLCGADSSPSQYSDPVASYSVVFTLSDATLSQSNLEYDSDITAGDALARLIQDSQSCPVVNEFTAVSYVGSDADDRSETAYFDLALESGQDGSIRNALVAVTRFANLLIEMVLTPDGTSAANADSRIRALDVAAMDRLVAAG